MSLKPNDGVPLSSQFLYTYKTLSQLRKHNKLNQIFDSYYKNQTQDDLENDYSEYRSQRCINEAYRICALFFSDNDPLADVEYIYERQIEDLLGEINADFTKAYVIILLEGYSKHSKKKTSNEHNAEIIKSFIDDFSSNIVYNKYFKDFLNIEYPPVLFENLELKAQPTPLSQLTCINYKGLAEATNNYDQDKIVEIINRYESNEDKIALIDIMKNVFNGLNPDGSFIKLKPEEDLPF